MRNQVKLMSAAVAACFAVSSAFAASPAVGIGTEWNKTGQTNPKYYPSTDNLTGVVGVTMEVSGNEGAWKNTPELLDGACLNNGLERTPSVGHVCSINGGSVLEVTFPGSCDLRAINLLTYAGKNSKNGGGRDGIAVESILVRAKDAADFAAIEDFVPCAVGMGASGAADASTSGACELMIAREDGSLLASGIGAVKVIFGTLENNGSLFDEVEVCGTLQITDTFHVRFLDRDGTTVLGEEDVNPGEAATAPVPPEHEGYVFVGWDKDFSAVGSSMDVTACYLLETAAIGTGVEWSTTAQPDPQFYPSADNLLGSAGVSLTLSGNEGAWHSRAEQLDSACLVNGLDRDGTLGHYCSIGNCAVLDVTFPGSCDLRAINLLTYAINVGDGLRDGISVSSIQVRAKGASEFAEIANFETPCEVGMNSTSSGACELIIARLDESYLATGIDAVRVVFGNTENNGSIFDEVEVCGTLKTADSFHVRFLDQDVVTVVKEEDVKPGEDATAPTPLEHKGYRFTGWSEDFTNIGSDLDVVAQYIAIHTVRFLDRDGVNVLKTEVVDDGTDAVPPEVPEVEGVTFVGWSGSYKGVTADADLVARYVANDAPCWQSETIYGSSKSTDYSKYAFASNNVAEFGGTRWVLKAEEIDGDLMLEDGACVSGIGTDPTPRYDRLIDTWSQMNSDYYVRIPNGDVLDFAFAGPRQVDSFTIYTCGYGASMDAYQKYNALSVAKVEYKSSAKGAFKPLPNSESVIIEALDETPSNGYCYRIVVRHPDGSPLVEKAAAIRVTFGTTPAGEAWLSEFVIKGGLVAKKPLTIFVR